MDEIKYVATVTKYKADNVIISKAVCLHSNIQPPTTQPLQKLLIHKNILRNKNSQIKEGCRAP